MNDSGTDERLEPGDLAHMPRERIVAALEGPWVDHLADHLPQLDRADLAGMSPEAINKCRRMGLLDSILGGKEKPEGVDAPDPGQWTRADLAGKTEAEILGAYRAGKLTGLLAHQPYGRKK